MLSFHDKFVQTDGRTDRWTMVKQYAPDLLIRRHIKETMMVTTIFSYFHNVFYHINDRIHYTIVEGRILNQMQ